MILPSLLTEGIYRHKNGLKHINIVNSDGFSALFVVNTPIFDNSGVAHGVEHMVFRRSTAFPKPETLFQLTSLTDAKINASTCADTTYFHCQSQCYHTFILVIRYLLNGLFNPIFDAEDLRCEIHDGHDKGVIYHELIGIEQAEQKTTEAKNKNNFCYGGISSSIGKLSLNDLTTFHQRFYHENNITLLTSNADIEQIANLITLLPKQTNQSQQIKTGVDKHIKKSQRNDSNEHPKKYPQAINKLMTLYHLWLEDPDYQKMYDYTEIEIANKPLDSDTENLPPSHLISPLITLSNKLIKDAKNDRGIKISASKPSLPHLFNTLYQQAKQSLTSNELNHQRNVACASDQHNALWLVNIGDTEQEIANITSYIISAYPMFLAPRYQGLCYATQALTIEDSTYLAIYSAFGVNPDTRLKEVNLCLLRLSQDNSFINTSLALAKIKYCRTYLVSNSQVINITSTHIANYLQMLVKNHHPKV